MACFFFLILEVKLASKAENAKIFTTPPALAMLPLCG
jgi:hypothetical protein